MKKILFLATLCGLASCSSPIDDMTAAQQSKQITFSVSESIPMSRATLADACSRLSYFRCTDGEVVTEVHQSDTDTGFGSVTDNMKYGTHEVYFVGYNSTTPVSFEAEDEGYTYTFDKVSDTFSYYAEVTIDKASDESQTITMPRRVARFEMVATDALPANLATMDVRIEGAATALNAETGKGTAEVVQTKSITIPAANIGKTDCTFIAYAFLLDDTATLTVILTAKDADGATIQSHTLTDVEMETNYITRYTGNFFASGIGSQVSASTEWTGVKENEL